MQATGNAIRTSPKRNPRISGGGSTAVPARGRSCWPWASRDVVTGPKATKRTCSQSARAMKSMAGSSVPHGRRISVSGASTRRSSPKTRLPPIGIWARLRNACMMAASTTAFRGKVVSTRLAGYAGLRNEFDRRMAEVETRSSDRSISERRDQTRLRNERPDWHDLVKPHEGELRENVAGHALLSELSKVYFGGYLNVRGNSPRERLNTILAGDTSLVEAVLSGFARPSNGTICPRTGRSYASESRIERTALRIHSWRVWKKFPRPHRPAR